MADVAGSVDAGNPEPVTAPVSEPVAAPVVEAAAVPVVETSWIDSVQDPDLKGWAEKKGLNNGSFENVLGSYHNLEKMFGADKAGHTFTLPGPDATPEEMGAFYTKLGRPDAPEGYEVAVPDGSQPDFANWAQGVFHDAGLSKAQADKVTAEWGNYVGTTTQSNTEAQELAATNATNELKQKWGAAYETRVKTVDSTAVNLGMTSDELTALNAALGGTRAMEFVYNMGAQLGDHAMEDGDSVNTNAMTPEGAKTALNELMGSKDFQEAWHVKSHPNHRAMVEKKAQLSRMIAGGAV
jgi:hypothetical protein|tara:strand:+ start:585 stop:1472 length:888 start_codon:yes stop_codon:yes gene_type:complete